MIFESWLAASITFAVAIFKRNKTRIRWPWFIALFCLGAAAATYLPLRPIDPKISRLGQAGLTVTLYLIGTGISCSTLQQVGWRPMLQGIVLWAIVATCSLTLIRLGMIAI